MIFDWFQEKQGVIKEPVQVYVISRLYEDGPIEKQQPSPLMAKYVSRCSNYPGKPRLVYLWFADPKGDDAYLPKLRDYLSDVNVADNELGRLVAHRRKVILDSVDITDLSISEKRRSLIRNSLSAERTEANERKTKGKQ